MRHVSRTDRVALDWLFDTISFDSKIQIRYIDTKHQLADILSKGNFARDEWNNLLQLFNISHFSSTCCAKNSSLISCPETMAKGMQEQKGSRKKCGKIRNLQRWTCLHMFLTSSSFAKSPIASKSPGILIATGKTWKQDEKEFKIRRSVEFSSATARCTPRRFDGHSHG